VALEHGRKDLANLAGQIVVLVSSSAGHGRRRGIELVGGGGVHGGGKALLLVGLGDFHRLVVVGNVTVSCNGFSTVTAVSNTHTFAHADPNGDTTGQAPPQLLLGRARDAVHPSAADPRPFQQLCW